MKKIVLIVIFLVMQKSIAQDKTTIYLIRHAEKADQSANPDLSPAGVERVALWNLAGLVGSIGWHIWLSIVGITIRSREI